MKRAGSHFTMSLSLLSLWLGRAGWTGGEGGVCVDLRVLSGKCLSLRPYLG